MEIDPSITIEDYNPDWPAKFEAESARLRDLLGQAAERVHHIGSTSVHGLRAKPIIDILIETPQLAALDRQNSRMETAGYEVMGEFGIPHRRYFRKVVAGQRVNHVHAFPTGHSQALRHLAFRDALRKNAGLREDYAALKTHLAEQANMSRLDYGAGKQPFIDRVEKQALADSSRN